MQPLIEFTVYGLPQSAGSKRAMVLTNKKTGEPFRNKSGRIVVNVTDDNPKSRDWKHAVADAARQKYSGELLKGPLHACFVFFLPRPKGHYGTGRNANTVKSSSPREPISKPDVLKLARAAEDALSKVLWLDDSQIVLETLQKTYGSPARMSVVIREWVF